MGDDGRENAELAIRQKLAQKATQDERLAALQEALGLPQSVQRIECFDVSHTMGEAAVASCVIFDRLAMQTVANTGASTSSRRSAATIMRRCARR